MKILFLDTETTGLVTKSTDFMAQPGICQIGAIRLTQHPDPEPGESPLIEEAHLNILVNPELVKWQEDAIKTHGITPDMVRDAPTMFEVGPMLSKFAVGCDAWYGYNTRFDQDVLWYQLLKYGLERTFPWPPITVDVMQLASRKMELQGKKGTKNPSLSEAYRHFYGTEFSGAHDALSDIRATIKVWEACRGA
jgi:DNA polymerase III epsilon subunit-like protein